MPLCSYINDGNLTASEREESINQGGEIYIEKHRKTSGAVVEEHPKKERNDQEDEHIADSEDDESMKEDDLISEGFRKCIPIST